MIEALVSAVIVGIALLFLIALLAHESRLTVRAAAQHDAVMLLEAALEGLRAGAVELKEGRTTYEDAMPPWLPIPERRNARLWIDAKPVEPADLDGLWEVTAEVRYRAGRDVLTRSLTTRVWKP